MIKKRILILEQQSWLGGAQRVLDVIINSLNAEFDATVAFPDAGAFSAALRDKRIRTSMYPLGTYRPGRKSVKEMLIFPFRSLVCAFKAARWIHNERIVLVYINGPRCLPAGVLAAWITGRPSVFHSHLVLTRKLELLLVTRLARHVSAILACSQAAAKCLLERDPTLASKTKVLHSPVPGKHAVCKPARIPLGAGTDDITIGMVGRITESKGHWAALGALARLRPELQARTRLIVVGAAAPGCDKDIQYAYRLREYAASLGLEERILWAGYQEDPDPYYAVMDVLLQPSSAEALGLTILEALQRGIPVVASRIGGIPEIIRDEINGLLVSPEDEDALVRSLERFIEDHELRNRLTAGASLGIDEHFLPETFRPAIRDLICGLCNSSERSEELAPWK